ncbi:MAG: transglutaminase domain-containing protein [Candidatus Coproplasma sp.]
MKKSFLIFIFSLAVALCAVFGFTGCDLLSLLKPEHTHTPSPNYQSDSAYHWHECTQEGCNEKLDKEEHTSSSYITDKDGHYKICSECCERFDEGVHLDGESCSICGYVPNHTHTLEHVDGKEASCTTDGNVEYWHCTGCNNNYSDKDATTVLTSVIINSTGHSGVSKHDETTHWEECENCYTILVSAQEHTATTYTKNKEGHYKICTECGAKFDEGTHVNGEDCSICGYTPEYTDLCASSYGYNYLGTLENGEQLQSLYNQIDEAVKSFHTDENKNATATYVSNTTVYVAEKIYYSSLGLTKSQAQSVWATYRHDNPLYYWLIGQIVSSSQAISLCVDSDYIYGSERVLQNQSIYLAIDEYLNAVQGETSAYQTAFAFHDMIIDNIDYAYDDEGNPETANWAHSILGVLNGGSAVCEGYAKAYALLLNAIGIENAYVTGSSKGVGHAWNMVNLDGNWYWYDLTWDDQPNYESGIIYDYMCKSGETFADHTVNETGDFTNPMNFLYALPTASTADYNTDSIEYGEQFALTNLSYEVCGYNRVRVVSSSSLSGEVVLSESVTYEGRTYALTEIGTNAFRNNRQITSLTIPKSVRVIHNFAVNGCSKLSYVTFEDKTGWSRTCNNTTEQIEQSSLESTSSSASLLKETYKVLLTQYEYTWIKAV